MSISDYFPTDSNFIWTTLLNTSVQCFDEKNDSTKEEFHAYLRHKFTLNLIDNDCPNFRYISMIVDFATEHIYPIIKTIEKPNRVFDSYVVIIIAYKLSLTLTTENDKKSLNDFVDFCCYRYATFILEPLEKGVESFFSPSFKHRIIVNATNLKKYHEIFIRIFYLCKKSILAAVIKNMKLGMESFPRMYSHVTNIEKYAKESVNQLFPEIKDINID